MKMIIPKKINVMGIEIDVIECEKASDVDWKGQETLWGQYQSWENRIRLYKGLKPAHKYSVFLHEIIHAIISLSGLEQMIDLPKSENICDIISSVLTDTLTRNNMVKK